MKQQKSINLSEVKTLIENSSQTDKYAKKNNILIYKQFCPYSEKLKSILKQLNLPITIIVVYDNCKGYNKLKEFLKRYCNMSNTFPKLFINGKCIGGCDAVQDYLLKSKTFHANENASYHPLYTFALNAKQY